MRKLYFCKSEDGSSAIEFAFYIFTFVLMCGFLVDISFAVIIKGQAERINNSLISVLRERDNFFNGNESIYKTDLDNLKSIADVLLVRENNQVMPYQLGIRMISFSTNSTDRKKIVNQDINFETAKIAGCDIKAGRTTQSRLSSLSSWGIPPSATRNTTASWYPVYEVTLCIPGAVSYFQQAMGKFDQNLGNLSIHNAAIPRL